MQQSIDENKEKHIGLLDIFTTSSILKPTMLVLVLMFFQVGTGVDIVSFFSVTIFQASGSNISPHLSSIGVGVIQIIASFLSSVVIDRFGRRPLLLISEIVIMISLFTIGLFFYLRSYDESVVVTLSWLPLASLLLFSIGFALGMGPVPFIYLEILPTHVAGKTKININNRWISVIICMPVITLYRQDDWTC